MASVFTLEEVNQWFEETKGHQDAIEDELAETARLRIFSRLAFRFDVTAWTDSTDTPAIVRKAVSAYYASVVYSRNYSESMENDNPWSAYLRSQALWIVADLVDGVGALI